MNSVALKKKIILSSRKRLPRSKNELFREFEKASSTGISEKSTEGNGDFPVTSTELSTDVDLKPGRKVKKTTFKEPQQFELDVNDTPWLRLRDHSDEGDESFLIEDDDEGVEYGGEDGFEVVQAATQIAIDSDEDITESDENEEYKGKKKYELMEMKSKKLDRIRSTLHEDAYAELKEKEEEDTRVGLESEGFFEFPSEEILYKEKQLGVDFEIIKTRYKATLQILKNWSSVRSRCGKNRSDYIGLLKNDLAYYYGYNEFLMDKIFTIFGFDEAVEFIQSNEGNRPITIRVNSMKTRRVDLIKALRGRGVSLEPIEWNKYAIQIFESSVPIGATTEYLAGHYILQSASSLTVVMSLDPQAGERILDMCSAPGGKATYIAQLMKNTGTLVVNDVNKSRIPSLIANLHRLNVTNTIVCNYDGAELPNLMKGFNRVLLDAPCSGTGIISRDPSVKLSKSQVDLVKLGNTQRELILAAIDCVDIKGPNSGIIVYSTCSILIEENEAIIDYALKKRYVRVIDTSLEFGIPGLVNCHGKKFCDSIKLARRFYPHVYNMDGFFVCKLKKYKDGPRIHKKDSIEPANPEPTPKPNPKKAPSRPKAEEFVEIPPSPPDNKNL